MIITEKMIKELQRRVDVSYEEAERFLRRAGGNIDIAETYANRKDNSLFNRFFREIEKIINATLIYRIKLYKDEDVFMNLPILFFIAAALIIGINKALFLGVIFIVIALIADCNLQITKYENKKEFRFYQTVRKSKKEKGQESHTTETDHNSTTVNTINVSNIQEPDEEANRDYKTSGVIRKDKTIQKNNTIQQENLIQKDYAIQRDNTIQTDNIIRTDNTIHKDSAKQKDKEAQKSDVNQHDLLDEDDGYYEVTIDK